MELIIERDMPECEKWNMEPTCREEDKDLETTYEIAEKEMWEDYYREAKLGAI